MHVPERSKHAFLHHLRQLAESLAAGDRVRCAVDDLMCSSTDSNQVVIHDDHDLTVRVIRWQPGHVGEWHDHGGRHGCIVVMRGKVLEAVRTPNGFVDVIEHGPGQPRAFMSAPVYIHKLCNPSPDSIAVSLHVYCNG